MYTQPFEPFTIHVADGRGVPVPHPDLVSVDRKGRVVHVFLEDGRSEFIDFMLVTSIELDDDKPRRGGAWTIGCHRAHRATLGVPHPFKGGGGRGRTIDSPHAQSSSLT